MGCGCGRKPRPSRADMLKARRLKMRKINLKNRRKRRKN